MSRHVMRLRYYCDMCLFTTLLLISVSFSVSGEENSEHGDRTTLLALRDGFTSGGTPPPDGSALSSWNSSFHFCQWQGVTCGKRHKRVTTIRLTEQMLDGVLPPSIGNLTFLRKLDLRNNSLHGQVPEEIGRLRRLRDLYLERNFFGGRIPVELSNCSNLHKLSFSINNFSGLIPVQFGSLPKLIVLYVDGNKLVGEMPSFLSNFSSLIELDLSDNHFYGEIRNSLQGLTDLTFLSLGLNNFSGSISPLYNMSSLGTLEIAMNHFSGTLAQDMGVSFPKASGLDFSYNNFTGAIPSSISNISGLIYFQVYTNSMTGRVPDNLGRLKHLRILQLAHNHFGNSEESNDLSFFGSLTNCTKLEYLILNDNRFGGSLPDSIVNFSSSLYFLSMYNNYITGRIPEAIGELSGLSVIRFRGNLLTGVIPNSLGKLGNISKLDLSGNNLDGGIPSSIGNLKNLLELQLQGNSLNGTVPSTLGNCEGMEYIDISSNHLTGNLLEDSIISMSSGFRNLWYCDISRNSFGGIFPLVSGKLGVLRALYVSYNNFSGQIPTDLGEAVQLEYLAMAANSFDGSIPESLGRLKSLVKLDLSSNNLSGTIPKDLASIDSLRNLNLSFNKLEGEVPFFKNVSAVSVVGNSGLCGGNPELHFQTCKHNLSNQGGILSRKGVIAISVSALASFSLFVIVCIFFRGRRKHKQDEVGSLAEGYKRVTYSELFKATDGFAESNLIGTGSFGDVYKAVILDQNERKPVAVKVLKLSDHRAAESFTAECNVLKRIRHRNLLSIVTSCSSLDSKGNDFKALVFDFMSNGNLHDWLHSGDYSQVDTGRVLSLAKRLEIAIDVGSALDYLHNGCETPIVHCDLKPSNILLDEDMVAHVGDFGLAKLLLGDSSGGESMSTALKGSIGYVAPEYGMGAVISPLGDTYSYGVLLLELITGRRPTDDMPINEMSLRSFCERALPDNVEEVVDQRLVNEMQRNPEQIKLQFLSLLVSFTEVGISCAAESSGDRMDVQSAVNRLKGLKEKHDRVC